MRNRHPTSAWIGLLALLLALNTGPAQAGCATPYAIRTRVEEAFRAYDVWDFDRFHEVLGEARARLACVDGVLGRDDVARYMMLEAAAAGLERDAGAAVAWFRGLRAADPDFTLTTELAPPGSLLRSAWEIAVASGEGPSLPLATDGWIVDGEIGAARLPTERAAVVQRTMPGLQTWVLRGGELPEDLRAQLGVQVAVRDGEDITEKIESAPVMEPSPPRSFDGRARASAATTATADARGRTKGPPPLSEPGRGALPQSERRGNSALALSPWVFSGSAGLPVSLSLGRHSQGRNANGGFGLDGAGFEVSVGILYYSTVYTRFDLSTRWKLSVNAGIGRGLVDMSEYYPSAAVTLRRSSRRKDNRFTQLGVRALYIDDDDFPVIALPVLSIGYDWRLSKSR